MAEGHSVVRWARWLSPLVGERLVALDPPKKWQALAAQILNSSPTNGREHLRLESIRTHGKHLLLHLSDGHTIHCHGLMYGSWQVGKLGMKLRKPENRARLRLRTDRHEGVFFNGPVVEFLTPAELKSHERLRSLGPDMLHGDFDRQEVWRRLNLKKNLKREIGDAVLDQTILAGIGNIFKSEGLFLAKIDPRHKVAELPRSQIERIWDCTIPLMQAAAKSTGAILTLPLNFRRGKKGRDALNFVYFRSGKACYLCGATILRIVQGQLQRSTYFCPKCQK